MFIRPSSKEHCRVCGTKILHGGKYDYRIAYRRTTVNITGTEEIDTMEQYAVCKVCGAEISVEAVDNHNKKKISEIREKHKGV